MSSMVHVLEIGLGRRVSGVLLIEDARAQSYPAKPIRIVMGFPLGGAVDFVGRLVGQKLSEGLGQPGVIENRPGTAWQRRRARPRTSSVDSVEVGRIGKAADFRSALDKQGLVPAPGSREQFAALIDGTIEQTIALSKTVGLK